MKYIQQDAGPKGCIFCDGVKLADGPENLIVARGTLAFVMLNRYPYTSGHLMVVPYAHQSSFELLDTATRSEIMELMTRAMGVLRTAYAPEGFNVGANIGAPAGAGIAEHVHFHIVPRWTGDSNFMSTVADTRVLPEALEETFSKIKTAW